MFFTSEEKEQYNRHFVLPEIGEQGQQQLKNAKVLVVGAGGLGCPILQYLTAAGVGTIGIIDGDTVSTSNLQRQVLYTVADVGNPKVLVAQKRLEALNPFVKLQPFVEYLSKENAIHLFRQFDIVVDASDNFPTRYLINDASILTGKPLIFGSISKFEGQVTVFNYQNGGSYRCLYPQPPKTAASDGSALGVLGVLPGIIGCLQANEVIKIICGIGDVLSGKLLTYNVLSMQQLILKYKKTALANITALAEEYN